MTAPWAARSTYQKCTGVRLAAQAIPPQRAATRLIASTATPSTRTPGADASERPAPASAETFHEDLDAEARELRAREEVAA